MPQIEKVYRFIVENYRENEPIFLSDLVINDVKDVSVRQQVKKLTEEGRLRRYATGIYFLPKESMFKFGSTLSINEIINKKYISDGKSVCGYLTGLSFANSIGLTTQNPAVFEVCSNKATTDYREIEIGNFRIELRKPYVTISNKNVAALQFLDLMKDVSKLSELEGAGLKKKLRKYLNDKNLRFTDIKPYLMYYPDRIYKNMFEVGLLDGVDT